MRLGFHGANLPRVLKCGKGKMRTSGELLSSSHSDLLIKLQIPSTNIQRNFKLQAPIDARLRLEAWNLVLLWSLDVDAWSFTTTSSSPLRPGYAIESERIIL